MNIVYFADKKEMSSNKKKQQQFEKFIERCNELGYKCISNSDAYAHNKSKFMVQCNNDHSPYLVTFNNFTSGKRTKCPECYNEKKKITRDSIIEEFQLERYRNLKFINAYKTEDIAREHQKQKTDFKWTVVYCCEKEHEVQLKYNVFKGLRGTNGCKICKNETLVENNRTKVVKKTFMSPNILHDNDFESTGERICRFTLEYIFNEPCIKYYPEWLRNGQELDGICLSQNVAFEYNGKQHYEYTPFFHSSYEKFEHQKRIDQNKHIKCKENGIYLIEIPYTIDFVDIPQFIISNLIKNQLDIDESINIHDLADHIESRTNDYFREFNLEIRNIIDIHKHGRLVFDIFITPKTFVYIYCNNNHIFKRRADEIVNHKWCYECFNDEVDTRNINLLPELQRRNIRLINENMTIKEKREIHIVEVHCDTHDHMFVCDYDNIIRALKEDSPICRITGTENAKSSRRKSINDIENQINCILQSEKYKNQYEMHTWKCKVCSYIFEGKYCNLKGLKSPCRSCRSITMSNKLQSNNMKFVEINEVNLFNNDADIYKIECLDCTNIFESSIRRLKDSGFVCISCKKPNSPCHEWLNNHNIYTENTNKLTTKDKIYVKCKTCHEYIDKEQVSIENLKKRIIRLGLESLCCIEEKK